ncbi:MAG: DUF5686 and carboxypeptidase regulatory-like domain-containing protein [Bacteroidales bacterium]|nr:DUF5686 and carboxypeptidase regulatory-like domain-containing protein [Bacteroidales bacterium]
MKTAFARLLLVLFVLAISSSMSPNVLFAQSKRQSVKKSQPTKQQTLSTKERTIVGIIMDSDTREPIPFSNAYIKGTLIGTVSDFDGNFKIKTPAGTDSLSFNSMGYIDMSMPLSALGNDTNRIYLKSNTIAINEIKVTPDDAPRRIVKATIRNKSRNNPAKYDRTKFEKYVRWEYAINNIGEKNWLLKGANDLMKLDEDSNRYLPVYFSETLSLNETQKKPKKMRSTIIADEVKGIDVFKQYEIGGFSSALDQEVSFYDDIVKMFGVGFVSPIADNALQYYKYYIVDSAYTDVDSTMIYTIKYRPKNEGDKTFIGTMDIETKHFSLMRVDAEMPKYTNINFVKKLLINSTYKFVNDTIPFYGTNEMEMHIDYMPVNSDKKRLEIKCHMYNSQDKIEVNMPGELELSAKALQYETIKLPGYKQRDADFWDEHRHNELSEKDKDANNSIDSLNNVGNVKKFNLLAKLALTGFLDCGKWEIGPYTEVFNTNKIEGVHLGVGIRNSKEISEQWMLMGVVGIGCKNGRPTYQAGMGYRFNSPMRRAIEASYYDRLVKIGENENILYLYENMLTTSETNIIAQIFKREAIDELMYERQARIKYDHEWITGISSKFGINARWQYSPKFYPFKQEGREIYRVMQQEISIDTRFSFNEKYIDDGMQRVYMSTDYPIIHITLAGGHTIVDEKESNYARIHSTLKHQSYIGQTELDYAVEGGLFIGHLPYSVLEMPRGNKTYGFYRYDFNMMDYLEFVADKYLYTYVDWYFNGRILHNIPKANRTGLREVIGFKAMIGSFSNKNLEMLDLPEKTSGVNKPYLEVSAGLDNIFRFFRADCVYRVTDSKTGAPRVGLRLQFNFKL